MRGFFGIGIENCKTEMNVGTLWRSAHALDADFIFAIGRRYRRQSSDTTKAWKHIPFYQYDTFDDFYKSLPRDCMLIGVEYPHEKASNINTFCHPERCVYLLGAEDNGLTRKAIDSCHGLVHIPCKHCLNVSVAGSIIMFDRKAKL